MSNPDPNLPPDLKRESRRHIGPLLGMALVVIFGVGMILWWLAEDTVQAPGPDGDGTMTQEEAMEPPASPGEGGVDSDGASGGTGGEDAVGDPVPGDAPVVPDE